MRHATLAIPFMLISSTFAQAPAAEPTDAAPAALTKVEPSRGLSIGQTPRVEHTFDADIRNTPASVSITRAGLALDLSAPFADRWAWTLTVDYEASFYNFSDSSTLLPSGDDPLDTVHDLTFRPGLAYVVDNNWSVFGGGIIEFAGESGADIGDAATYGGFAGARYKLSDKLSLSLGFAVQSRLENSASFFPLLGVDWQISDRVRLSSFGPGLRLTANINDDWAVFIAGTFHRREYRLDDDGSIPSGIIRDRRARFGAGVSYAPCDMVKLELFGGVDAFQRFYFDDENGHRVASEKTQSAPFIALSAAIRF